MANMNPVRRKLAIATWSAPSEGNIFGKLQLDACEVIAYLDWLRAQSGEKVTLTHFIGVAVGRALAKSPGLNGVIRLGSYVPKSTVDIAYLVALEGGANLAKAKVCNIDTKRTEDVACELRQLAEKLHKGEDENFKKSMGPIKFLPTWLIRPIVKITGWLTGVMGVSVPALGLEAYPFGSCVITSVGVFGLDEGFAPFTPFAHVPLLVLIGAVRDMPWVVDGSIQVRPLITVTATIDHRYMDGAQGAVLAKTMRELFANPWQLSGLDGRPAEAPLPALSAKNHTESIVKPE